MKSILRYIGILIVFLFIIGDDVLSQCQITADFNAFQMNGMSTTIQWQPLSSSSVICNSSDWQPSFFVNSDSLLNVKITGEIFVNSSTGDDDFIGFVFGYKSPTLGTPANDNHFYLFDWKKEGQHAPEDFGNFFAKEGFSLVRTNGLIPGDPISTYQYFWGHELGDNFVPLAGKYGNNLGWEYDTTYNFELIYTYNKIIIIINGEEIFNLDGCFRPGLFGLYTFNQNGAIFRNVKVEQVYNISFFTDEDEFCEERPIQFSFLDTSCTYVPSSLTFYEWSFGDQSDPNYDLIPSHSFYDPGPYNVELRVTNTEDCTDTVTKLIFIEPKPQIVEHPNDNYCYVGDQVKFRVNALYGETYRWIYQSADMNIWRNVQNNGYFSGASTPELTVYNVRPNFDQMKFRCVIDGRCNNNLVTSQYAQILITDVPVRAYINPVEEEICTYDSITTVLTIQEPYQIDKAKIRLLYDDSDLLFTGYSAHLGNMIFTVNAESNYLDISINILNAVNVDQAVFASFNFKSIGSQTKFSEFSWDPDNTYFIDENSDTIYQYLYNSAIQLNHPYGSEIEDTISLCRGESIHLLPDKFTQVNWSTGETSYSIIPVESGEYSVELTDINQCENEDHFYVQLEEQPVKATDIFFNQEYYCSFDDSIEFQIQGGSGRYVKIGFGENEIIDSVASELKYKILNTGKPFDIYTNWINQCGESDIISKHVDVRDVAHPSVHLYSDFQDYELGDRVTVYADVIDGGTSPQFVWSMDDIPIQIGDNNIYSTNELTKSQELSILMHSNANCILGPVSVSDRLFIKLRTNNESYIPTLVTPNGDGDDDTFRVIFKDVINLEHFHLNIFDIRGRLLFSSTDITEEWDGNNTLYAGGIEILTYFITYKFTNSTEQTISGKFLLKK